MKQKRILYAMAAIMTIWIAPAAAKTNMLAFIPADSQFQSVLSSIQAELDTSYVIKVVDMRKPFKTGVVARKCRKDSVKALILMDRKAILAVQELQKRDSSIVSMRNSYT